MAGFRFSGRVFLRPVMWGIQASLGLTAVNSGGLRRERPALRVRLLYERALSSISIDVKRRPLSPDCLASEGFRRVRVSYTPRSAMAFVTVRPLGPVSS